MEDMIHGSMEEEGGCRVDVNEMREAFMLGVGELMERCSVKNQQAAKEARIIKMNSSTNSSGSSGSTSNQEGSSTNSSENQTLLNISKRRNGTAIAAATSLALCIINRFMIASGAISSSNDNSASYNNSSLLHRKEDTGILSMISTGALASSTSSKNASEQRMAQRRARGFLSPRIFILQASEDNTLDYNAFMNCVFCANKNDIVIDGCFIASGAKGQPDTSTFLEQACDRTGGVYSTPKGRSQICGGLTSVFMTLFLPTLAVRKGLNMTKVNKVDFRARCFETGTSLEIGMVCNLCLSIFKDEPNDGFCHTCGAKIIVPGAAAAKSMNAENNDDEDSRSLKRTKR